MKKNLWLLCLLLTGCFLAKPGIHTEPAPVSVLTVMSYNIHTGKGMDGVFSLERIADEIKKADVDLAGIQEVDRFTRRNPLDEAARLEDLTGLYTVFSKNLDYEGGEYGICVMSRYRVLEHRSFHYTELKGREPRGALAVKVKPEGLNRPVWCVTTHLGTDETGTEQLGQVKELMGWLKNFEKRGAIIVAGDFNQTPDSPAIRFISRKFVDLWRLKGKGKGFTFNTAVPSRRIDYVFVNERDLSDCVKIFVPETKSSDHRPVVAKIVLKNQRIGVRLMRNLK